MINPAAMVGLDNNPALKAIKSTQQGILKLIDLKVLDQKRDTAELKREQQQEKKLRQDYQRLSSTDAREMAKAKRLMETTDGGALAMAMGASLAVGTLLKVFGQSIVDLVEQIKEGIIKFIPGAKEFIEGFTQTGGTPADVDSTGAPAGAELDPAAGGLEDLSEAEGDSDNLKNLVKPEYMEVTSRFGPRWGKIHRGVDIAVPEGTPMTVWEPAVVTDKGYEKSGYGHYVVFKTAKGEHLYAHMTKPTKYGKGASVKRGDVIGYAGNSGGSKGAHLHWEFDPKMGVVGYKATRDVLKEGYKPSMPFLGRQKGGAIGKATHYIKDHEALASLTPGKWDWVKPKAGARSYASKTPWEKVNNKTMIYPYRDRGSKRTPTIGWGTTWLNGMMSGQNPVTMQTPPMTKKKADDHMTKDVASLAAHLSRTIKHWKNLTETQKAGFISIGYNAGQNAHTSKRAYPKYAAAVQSGDMNKVISPDVMPHFSSRASRRKDEINMLKQGPMNFAKSGKKQAGGIIRPPVPTVGLQAGGMVGSKYKNAELTSHYTPDFYVQQSEQETGSTIIIVNKVGGSSPSPKHMMPSKPNDPTGGTDMPSYTDIAHLYSSFCRGIKI